MEILIILLAIALGYSGAMELKSEAPKQIEESVNKTVETSGRIKMLDSYSIMTVDAEDWLCHYADNAMNQKKQFKIKENWKNKIIKLKGEIYKVHIDKMDGCRITIRQQRSKSPADGWCIISCYFYDDAEIEKLKDLKKGDRVSIVGYSRWDLGPILINSSIH
jgi:hypothetical protein